MAIGETGLDYYRDYAPRADQERAFAAQIELARETGKPLVIHTRAADDDTIAMLREQAAGVDVILHCFSMPDRLDECVEQGWWISFAGNVTYPKAADLAAAAARVPAERLLVETDAPYLTPQPVRKQRNQPAYVVHTARFVAERRGSRTRSSSSSSSATPPRCSAGEPADAAPAARDHAAEPAPHARVRRPPQARPRPELPHRLEPPRRHRARGASWSPATSCSRSAAASACCRSTSPRASRTCTSSSSTAALEPALRDALDRFENVTLHFADAMELDLRALDPVPTKVVANLPYGIAAGAILRTIEELERGALGRHGPEGGRRALRRGARHERLRRCPRCSPSWPATCRCCEPCRARSSRRFPTSTRCSSG